MKNLEFAKHCDVPVLVHVLTKKGRGLEAAVAHPEKFHGASPFDPITGESKKPAPGAQCTDRFAFHDSPFPFDTGAQLCAV